MSDNLVVLRQGEPVVVLHEKQAPVIIERELATAITVERHGTVLEQYQQGNSQAELDAVLQQAIMRANHTGTQPIETINGLRQELDSKLDEAALPTRYDGGFF